jgi:hypothetical protein
MPDEPHENSVANVDEVTDWFQRLGIPGLALHLALQITPSRPWGDPTASGA